MGLLVKEGGRNSAMQLQMPRYLRGVGLHV